MIIIGDSALYTDERFCKITKHSQLESIASDCIALFDGARVHFEGMRFCVDNGIDFAVIVKNLRDVIYASIQKASYIIVDDALAQDAQDLAENYMFDAKILQIIDHEDQIEEIAPNHIDGVVYRRALDGDC
jgi:hypothetical protein